MANVSSPLTPIYLTWTRSNVRGRYELTTNGVVLGSLQRVGFWKPASHAEFQGQSWSFKRSRVANTKVFQEPEPGLVAEFKANWLGGGMLTFTDGRQFQLTVKGFCRPVWSWADDHGVRLIEATPHNKSVVLLGTAAENCWRDAYLPVLVMLSWHQILQANDDAAAIAASAAAG